MRRQSGHIKLNRYRVSVFAGFICLYAVIYGAVLSPLLRLFSYLVMQTAGFRYLTAENAAQLFRHPLVYLAIAAAGLILACFELFEFSGLIYLFHAFRKDQSPSLPDTVRFAFVSVKEVWSRHYAGILLIVLFVSPMYHLASILNLLNSYSLFAMLVRSLQRHMYARLLLAAALLLYTALFVRWMFVVHIYTLESYGCRASCRHSVRRFHLLGKRKSLQVFVPQLLAALLFIVGNIAVIALIGLAKTWGFASGAAVSTVQVTFMRTMETVFDAVIVPVFLYSVGNLYYTIREADSGRIVESSRCRMRPIKIKVLQSRRCQNMFTALSLTAFAVYAGITATGQFTLRIEHLRTVEVSAHRGASMFYPENTMAAFQGALEQGADWIELDVQETRDGQLIVMHDASLKRTTGVDAKVWEMDYDEIRVLDAGSFFNSSFAGEPVPLLSDVIAFAAENGISLNIELKPTGHETNLVDGVLDLVEEQAFEDQCVITSQKYDILRQIKKRNENIQTVYVMGLAYGAINRLKAADAFSIRSTSITQSLVTDLHNRGLEVYAWTVDSRANLNRMINLGVDNIITNNVPLAIECINESRTESILKQMFQMLAERFK